MPTPLLVTHLAADTLTTAQEATTLCYTHIPYLSTYTLLPTSTGWEAWRSGAGGVNLLLPARNNSFPAPFFRAFWDMPFPLDCRRRGVARDAILTLYLPPRHPVHSPMCCSPSLWRGAIVRGYRMVRDVYAWPPSAALLPGCFTLARCGSER